MRLWTNTRGALPLAVRRRLPEGGVRKRAAWHMLWRARSKNKQILQGVGRERGARPSLNRAANRANGALLAAGKNGNHGGVKAGGSCDAGVWSLPLRNSLNHYGNSVSLFSALCASARLLEGRGRGRQQKSREESGTCMQNRMCEHEK